MKGAGSAISGTLFLAAATCLLPAFSGTGQPVDTAEEISISLETRPTESDRQGEATPKPQLVTAAYEVEVYGGMAVGTLIQELVQDGEEPVEASYRVTSGEELVFQQLALESKGRVRPLNAEPEPDPATTRKATATAGAKRPDTGPPVRQLRSDPFTIEAEEPLTLRASFRSALPVEGRLFRLSLPALNISSGAPTGNNTENGLPLRIQITIHHPEQLPLARSSTHPILVDFVGDRTIVETVAPSVPADRAFELEFAVNSPEQPTLAGYVREQKDGRRAVEALLTPPEEPAEEATRPRQVLFIIDTSGSMAHDQKLDQARRAVASSIEKLKPVDRFNIVEFDTKFRMMHAEPVELESFGRQRVEDWLGKLKAIGGTTLLPALAATLEQPTDPERHRMIIVVTDGILQDEQEALELVRRKLGDGRLFVVGTGPRIRQVTLLRLAEYGRGAAVFTGQPSELEAAVAELFDRFSRPLGWDLDFDWAGAEIEEILPSRLPDLYAGQAVRVVAWVDGDLPSALRLRMSTMEGERFFEVPLPPLDAAPGTR